MKSLAICSLLVLLALLAIPAAGLEPYLVKDINTVGEPAGSDPSHLVTFRGAVLFFADDGVLGHELWRSDGTAAGTFQLSEAAGELGDPREYAVTEQLYFFVSGNPIGDFPNLWVSDGTPAGTFRLTEPGVTVDRWPRVWIASQGVLYFRARDAEHGAELWRTDGTPAGTYLVADVRPGPEGSEIQELTAYRERAWFGADDGQHGGALWSSDGTAANTVLAVDPVPSSPSHASPVHIRVVGKRLTFFAPPPGRSRTPQLWAGDGSPRGTKPVSSLRSGSVVPEPPVVHGNRLYFMVEVNGGGKRQLWVSDGTGRGTRALASFSGFILFGPAWAQGIRGLFVFQGFDPVHGSEPWVTDGTPQGTRLLRDVCLGTCPSGMVPAGVVGGRLYFLAAEPGAANHLWSTDGTPQGTRRVTDADFGVVQAFFAAGGQLFFVAFTSEAGQEVWRTDGTAAGTFPVTDFEDPFLWEEDGFHGAVLDGTLLFRGEDGEHGAELWRTDGTAAGTGLVEDINRIDIGGSFPGRLRPLGDQVVFAARTGGDPELRKSDGTAAGTVRFRTFGPDELDGVPAGAFAEAGGLLVYFGNENDIYVPWRTDGTAAGTFRLTGEAVQGCCNPPEMEAAGSRVFFDLQDEEHGRELWVSDGTREGTRLVLDIVPGPANSEARELTAFQGKLYFTAGEDTRLWTSDGTTAGTVPLLDLKAGGEFSLPVHFTVYAGRLWFFADDGEHGKELWSSDGTEAGTRLEVEFAPGSGSFEVQFMASLGDRLIISLHGEGLWVTDGTPAGTRKIHDQEVMNMPHAVFQGRLYYVSLSSATVWVTDGTGERTGPFLDHEGREIFSPGRYAVLGDRLVFTAPDHFGVLKLWESDGTQAGTFQVQPPVLLNHPGELVRAGDRVFFPSYDTSTGWELWAVRPDSP
ncbi:MAG: hypothetical protein QOH06_1296 [Acidobacteriota bacterium]|jgi:ELWxxDGT repeat protein|nr:hypothetical protein [Acidobacteriota bacterium]